MFDVLTWVCTQSEVLREERKHKSFKRNRSEYFLFSTSLPKTREVHDSHSIEANKTFAMSRSSLPPFSGWKNSPPQTPFFSPTLGKVSLIFCFSLKVVASQPFCLINCTWKNRKLYWWLAPRGHVTLTGFYLQRRHKYVCEPRAYLWPAVSHSWKCNWTPGTTPHCQTGNNKDPVYFLIKVTNKFLNKKKTLPVL